MTKNMVVFWVGVRQAQRLQASHSYASFLPLQADIADFTGRKPI